MKCDKKVYNRLGKCLVGTLILPPILLIWCLIFVIGFVVLTICLPLGIYSCKGEGND